MQTDPACRLCLDGRTQPFYQGRRSYYRCSKCCLIQVATDHFLPHQAEKAEYDLHQNNPNDARYRKFLSRLFDPLHQRLGGRGRGLDFGSGPGPTLPLMFAEAGYEMAIYDVFYCDDPSCFSSRYDFITATEVVEHLHQPGETLGKLWNCLRPGGILGIMTKMALDREAFSRWHYKNDPTHVCFFSRKTFEWLADFLGAECEFVGDDVVMLGKCRRRKARAESQRRSAETSTDS